MITNPAALFVLTVMTVSTKLSTRLAYRTARKNAPKPNLTSSVSDHGETRMETPTYTHRPTGRTYSLARTSAEFAILHHLTGGAKFVRRGDLVDGSVWSVKA